MQWPECENHFGWDGLEDECIEPNEKFECPTCSVTLRYTIDERTYCGAQHKTVEVIDD